MSDVISKSAFAALIGVHPSRVSQYIAQRKITGDALIGEGRHARICVSVAIDQLKRTLDIEQRISSNGKAQLDMPERPAAPAADAPPTIEERIRRERLEQVQLQNERAREERAARAGVYTRTDDARREMGRLSAELLTIFDGALGEFANAIAAQSNLTSRDALHVLRSSWRSIRERASDREGQRAEALSALIPEGAEHASHGYPYNSEGYNSAVDLSDEPTQAVQ